MKNFTKQNFKTNPLWIRLLIMAFMLVGANTAWSAYYAVGPAVGGWSTWVELKTTDNNKYTCIASPGEFKITTEKNGWGFDKNWNTVQGGTGVTKNYNNGQNATLQSGYNQICYYPTGNSNQGWLEGEKVSVTASDYVLGGYFNSADKNYNSGKKLTKQSDGTYTGTFNDLSGDCYFQVFDDVARIWGCDYTEKNVGESVTLSTSKSDKVRYSLTNGTSYVVTFNPSNGSFLIKLACVTLTAPTLTVTDVKKCNTDYIDGKITISGYDENTYTYVLKNSSNQTVNKTYNSGYSFTKDEIGTYKVTMTRKDGTQCEAVTSDSKEIKITDNTPAIGEFSVSSSASSVCSGTQVTLKATSVNGASYQWFLNNSSTAISGASSYQYKPTITADATYKVVVSKTSNSCTATKNASVSVTAIPVASTNNFDITIPENAVYNGQKHSATATVKSGITGMGAVTVKHYKNGSEVDPIDAGDYVVKISVAAGDSYCAMSETQIGTFTINKADQTTPTISADLIDICGKEATFTVTGGESTGTYSYTLADNTAGVKRNGTTLTATQSGSVTLKVKKSGDNNYNESSEATETFTFTMPIENVTLTKVNDSKTTYCVGDRAEFKLTYSGPYPTSYAWSGTAMGSLEATGKTAKVLDNGASWYIDFSEAKTYTIALSLTGCNTDASDELSFTVNALPSAPGLKTASSIKVCPGNLTLANYVNVTTGTTVLWFTDEDCTQSANSPSIAAGERKVFYAKAKNTSTGCLSSGKTTLTIIAYSAPADFTLTAIPTQICSGENVVISISDKQDGVTYTLGKTEINESITVNPTQTTTYTVVASLDVCPALTNSISTAEIVVNPIPSFVTPPSNLSLCKGATNETNLTDLSHVEVANGFAVWYDAQTGGNAVAGANLETGGTYRYWVAAENSTTGCINPERKQFTLTINELPKYPELGKRSASLCQSNDTEDLDKLAEINDVVWYIGENEVNNAHTISLATAGTTIYTAKAVDGNGCQSATGAEFVLTIDAQPTFTAPAATQTNKEVTLTSAAGASTQWSVSPTENVRLTDNLDGTATFVATANGDYTITASNGVCDPVSHTIKVSDAFYIWIRNAKKGETAYENFYHKDQNTEDVRGGEMFYAECEKMPTNGNTSQPEYYVNYNKGGREAELVNTDCEGYTWYGFKASDEVIAGTKYFYVHATNDINNKGFFTHTVPTKKALTADVYYKLCETSANECGQAEDGWKIVEASAPYAGPMVHASGSTALGTDKFVALYVTDCSGKEITSYQWYKGTEPYSSVCSYVTKDGSVSSNAGETNNIRPTMAGNYSCTVTYKDGSTKTSAAVEVTGEYKNNFTSNIPVIVVNTNGEGFPDCTGLSGTASKNASIFKEKRSVDVKIYDGTSVIYDRKARMNYRGSSSLNFVKKSYAFCPGDANCEAKDGKDDYVKTAKLNMLGVGNACDKDWVLYAAAADPSLMRNRLVFDSYKAMTGKWGVNSRYVELIVDGVYKGVYVFMDKITMNKDRVKVDEDKGFIVKFDKTDKEDRVGGLNGIFGDEKTFKTSYTGKDDIGTYDTSIDQRFEIEYPEKDDYTTGWNARVNGIQGMFQAFEDALKQGDYATVQKYIDYTSWADWFIINEFTKNVDAYRASCIFVYTGEAGAKIEARPLWDQELSFNNQASTGTSDKGSNSTTGLLIQHSNVYSDAFGAPFWFTGGGSDITGGLLSDPCFVQVVKERWNMHQLGALSKKSLEDLIDKYEDDLAPEGTTDNAQTRETAFWNGKSRGKCDCNYDTGNPTATGYQNKTFAESTGTITNWISDAAASGATGRRAGLTTALNNLTGASFSIQILPSEVPTTPWEQAHIAVNVTPEGYDYVLEYTDNNLGGVTNIIIEENGNEMTYRIPRPASWSTGDEDTEGERADIEYGIKATLNVASGTIVCGSQAAPTSTAKIILQDEPNENCDK